MSSNNYEYSDYEKINIENSLLKEEVIILNLLIDELKLNLESQKETSRYEANLQENYLTHFYGFTAEQIVKDNAYTIGSLLLGKGCNKSLIIRLFLAYKQFKNINLENTLAYKKELTLEEFEKAEKVKSHLSYKIGLELIKVKRNPLEWLFLPYKILKEIRVFNKSKN